MRKTTEKKLVLRTETLHTLVGADLHNVVGGNVTIGNTLAVPTQKHEVGNTVGVMTQKHEVHNTLVPPPISIPSPRRSISWSAKAR
jgi:hypothetical protein